MKPISNNSESNDQSLGDPILLIQKSDQAAEPVLNTIYIISKGRPHCATAKTLEAMNYPGPWFIVCGTNDSTLPEYKKNWGDHVLVFDWAQEVEVSDLLDNFGVETMGSGAVPVRNATARLSFERNETRHWQFDDDYTGFYVVVKTKNGFKHHKLDGLGFQRRLQRLASFAHSYNGVNVGFALFTEMRPENKFTFARRVFNAHNMPSDPKFFHRWRGRMNDDLINALTTYTEGRAEYSFKVMYMNMKETQSEKGGNTDIYQASGTVRKTAYAILIQPNAVKLVYKFNRYHHHVNWNAVIPKTIHEKYR